MFSVLDEMVRQGARLTGILLHPSLGFWRDAVTELVTRNTNSLPESLSSLPSLGYTAEAERGAGQCTGRAVAQLAVSCRGRDPDRFEAVLKALVQVFEAAIRDWGFPRLNSRDNDVWGATQKADQYLQENFSNLLDQPVVRNPAAEALHQIANLIGPLLLDLETWAHGWLDDASIKKAWGGKAGGAWNATKEKIRQSGIDYSKLRVDEAVQQFEQVVTDLDRGRVDALTAHRHVNFRQTIFGPLERALLELQRKAK